MNRSEFYRAAFSNLGVAAVAQRAFSKSISRAPLLQLTSKHLEFPVFARRGTTDLLVFDMILVEREYRCLDDTTGIRTIIDAGANCGYSSAYLLSRFAGSRAICIEPDDDNFRLLQMNLAPFGERVEYVKGALWSEPTTLKFEDETTVRNNEWGRRTVEGNNSESTGSESTGLVEAIDMPTLIAKFNLDSIDLLKVDIEGAEKNVFSANTDWLDRVRNIVIELHNDACRIAFEQAIDGRDFRLDRCGELTVCSFG